MKKLSGFCCLAKVKNSKIIEVVLIGNKINSFSQEKNDWILGSLQKS